ncbi:hypothetical protein EIP91_005896 [Steccherinum ochraceum]|uniref:Epoxide hydrolase N-terminal domain-containing protein n=1 Tax=Steccherinum ochraceum TaxID=92696 RepID=A0A4R0RHF4_9APHY|nr:hypothetical protein EIP91_005896 [Steccherinum ochraceum]
MAHATEKSFKVSVPDSELELLRKKLDLVRFPDELDGSGWNYGAPLADVRRLVARWKDGYDWRTAEAKINELPQFTRDVDVDEFGTLNIHYVHVKSDAKDAIPLLFIHGWPGHFMEVSKMLPLLTSSSGDHPSFHVVACSLPNFGFSDAAKQTGFKIEKYAETLHKVMLALGYNEYAVQGGDWGYCVARSMAYAYGPKHVKAWHTNSPVSGPPTLYDSPLLYLKFMTTPFTAAETESFKRHQAKSYNTGGYMEIHRTKPQTIGYSLADSPVGLLAWIYEKLVAWTDKYPWDDDEVLTWVSIYWFSRAGPTASGRIYYEFLSRMAESTPPWSPVPLGLSYFPEEVAPYAPKLWMRTVGDVVFEAEHNAGGHFAAYEQPEALADDLRAMFSKPALAKLFK